MLDQLSQIGMQRRFPADELHHPDAKLCAFANDAQPVRGAHLPAGAVRTGLSVAVLAQQLAFSGDLYHINQRSAGTLAAATATPCSCPATAWVAPFSRPLQALRLLRDGGAYRESRPGAGLRLSASRATSTRLWKVAQAHSDDTRYVC